MMVDVYDWIKVRDAEETCKKRGWKLEVYNSRFHVTPTKGIASLGAGVLESTAAFHRLEDAMAFVDGAAFMERFMIRKMGMTVAEAKDKVESKRVLDALKGKRGTRS